MKIGIFSDSHDQVEKLVEIKKVFEENKVEIVIFCGDLVSPFNFMKLQQINWNIPIKAVFGNNEGDRLGIKRKALKYNIDIEYSKHGLTLDLEFDKCKIAVFHGHDKVITEALLNSQKYDLLCTGHTHVSHLKKVGKTIWINPGSLIKFSEESEPTSSIAIFDTDNLQGEIINL